MKTLANPCRRRLAALCLAMCTLPAAFAAQAQTAAPPALELVVLGSGGPGATGRAGSAFVVLVDGVARVFVDAGPVLDELKPDAARVAKALRNGLGQMPSYKDKLTEAEIAALALYVSKASGGAK